MNSLRINIDHRNLLALQKGVVWFTINSILFFSLISFEQENVSSVSNRQEAISIPIQNFLEQNFSERNLRNKSSEKFSLSETIFSFSAQTLTIPNDYRIISITESFLAVFTSTANNHSLRAPPLIL